MTTTSVVVSVAVGVAVLLTAGLVALTRGRPPGKAPARVTAMRATPAPD